MFWGSKKNKKKLIDPKKWLKFFKHFFIPNQNNDHKPKALRGKSLIWYVFIALVVKALATGFLFFMYPSPAVLSTIVASRMIEMVNQSRAENNLPFLREDNMLTLAALAKGEDMLAKQYFAHNTPEGKRPWEWINKKKYDYVFAGENLAMDFTEAESLHEAFLKSPAHRKNILNPKYKDMGAAVLNGEIDGRETTLLVQFFGAQRESMAGARLAHAAEVEPELEQSSEGLLKVTINRKASHDLANLVIEYSDILLTAFLIYVCLALILNIFIKREVQHYKMILQTASVIALLTAVVLVKLHFLENFTSELLIL